MSTVHIKLDKSFTTSLNKLLKEYGEEFARIEGLGEKQLNLTSFIDNFVDTKTVSDASIDGNANVASKAVPTLLNEMSKPYQKLTGYNKIFYELNKKYGYKVADKWLRAQWEGWLYLHDAPSASYYSYCYKGEECLVIKYKGELKHFNFKNLYDFLLKNGEEERFDETIGQFALFPQEVEVQDFNTEDDCTGWTKITRLVKHNNEKKMRFIKYSNGLSQIVTEDHPIITTEGEKPASEITEEDFVFSIKPDFFKETISSITTNLTEGQKKNHFLKGQGTFSLTKELGWLTGMILSEGAVSSSSVHITQNVDQEQYLKLLYILNKYEIPYSEYEPKDKKGVIRLNICPYTQWIFLTMKGLTSAYKALPPDYIYYSNDFLDGIVAGMIDGDGTIDGYKHRHCQIRVTSETLCHQLSTYLSTKGIYCSDRIPYIYNREGSFTQKLPMFGIGFPLTNEDYFLKIDSIKINNLYEPLIRKGDFKNKKYAYTYGITKVIENIEYIDNCPIVYDITTETSHFICNCILSHNCYAYDLKDLAEKGLYFIDNFNYEPPQHLGTFVDFVKEFVSYCSNSTSGACGMPNLIPYMYYFWKRDVTNGYYTRSPLDYAKQHIQRLVYALNQPFLRGQTQSAFTNVSIFDHQYLDALFGGAKFPDGSLMIEELEEIMEFQKVFLETVAEIRSKNMMTFPVLSISLLKKDGKFKDEEFARWACEHNRKWNDSNFFVDSSVTSLSNCCRLRNDIKDLYFNSIGGTALSVGSIKVNTINLAHIALATHSEQEYLTKLKEIVELDLQCLDVVRHIIMRNVEKGLLPIFSKGMIDETHCYNTVGVIGVYETMKTFGYTREDEFGNIYYTEKAEDFGKKIFDVIHNVKNVFSIDKDYKINCEAVPGESAAAKFLQKDKILYPNTVVEDLPLYGNQFIPLGIKTTLQERIRIAAMFDSFCNGGSILHINVDAPFDSTEKAWDMLNYVTDMGVTYFAFTGKIQACEKNHAFYGKKCPVCGGEVATEYSRIVGFWTPVRTYSKERKAEWKMRQWENINE